MTAGHKAARHRLDAHAHLMTPERTASGIRWIRRVVPDYADLPEDVRVTELLGEFQAERVGALWNLFYPLRPGQSEEINRWQRALADAYPPGGAAPGEQAPAALPVIIPFASVHAADDDPGAVVERAFGALDLAGLKLHPYVQRLDPLDPRLARALAATEESGRPLVVHTGFSEFYGERSLVEAVFGLARRYPGLKVVAAHMLYPDLDLSDWPELLERYENLYLDATNVLSLTAPGTPPGDDMQALLDRWSHRIVFGSDHPMGMAYPISRLYRLPGSIAPHGEALEDISWRTAARLVEPRRLPRTMALDAVIAE